MDPDSFVQKTEQPAGRRRRAGGRSAVKRIPDGTVLHRDNQWDIPRKRALFISDGLDSTTSGSDILEGHSDRPPEVEYSAIPKSGRPQDENVAKGLCSPSRQLEIAVVRLQKDIDDYRSELELTRTQTPAVAPRPPKRSGFTSTPVPRFSGKSNWEQYLPAEMSSVHALMDLALPRFAGLADGPRQVHPPWSDSPASPAPARLETSGEDDSRCSVDHMSVSSTYLNLDALSSSSGDD